MLRMMDFSAHSRVLWLDKNAMGEDGVELGDQCGPITPEKRAILEEKKHRDTNGGRFGQLLKVLGLDDDDEAL